MLRWETAEFLLPQALPLVCPWNFHSCVSTGVSLCTTPPCIFSLGHLAFSLLGKEKSKFPWRDGFAISIPSSSLELFWCDRRIAPSREWGDTIYLGLRWFCSERFVIYLPWETGGKDQNLMQGAFADTSDVNWCKHHSATGEARTMCLIVMVQFPNSSKLVFILFFWMWSTVWCIYFWKLCRVNGVEHANVNIKH